MDEMRFKINYRKKKSRENLEFYGEDALASHLKKNTVKALATYPYGKVHFTDKLIVAPALGVVADYRDIVWMYRSGGAGEGTGARVKLVLCLENGEKELISGVTEAPLAEYFQLCRRYNPQMLIGTENKKEKKAEYKDAVAHYEKWGANHAKPDLTDWDGYGSPEGFYRKETERAGQEPSAFGRDSTAAGQEPSRAKQPANMVNQMPYEPKPSAGALVPPSFKQMAFEDLPDAPADLPSMSAEAPKPPSFKLDPELYIYLNFFPNQKILAIKYYREATGVGLAEAKEEVEKIFHKYNRFPSDRIRVPSANAQAAGGGTAGSSGGGNYGGNSGNSGYAGGGGYGGSGSYAGNSGYAGSSRNSGYGGNAGNSGYGGNSSNSGYGGNAGNSSYNGSGGYGGNSGGGIFAGQKPKVNARVVIGWILVVQAIFGFAVDAMIVLVMAGQYRKFLGVPGIASSFIAVGIQCVVYLLVGRLLIRSGKKKR